MKSKFLRRSRSRRTCRHFAGHALAADHSFNINTALTTDDGGIGYSSY